MSTNKKLALSYTKPSREQIIRTVVTSTAIETGQPSERIEESIKAQRKKFAHLRLAV